MILARFSFVMTLSYLPLCHDFCQSANLEVTDFWKTSAVLSFGFGRFFFEIQTKISTDFDGEILCLKILAQDKIEQQL